jgi:hypothetical protein
LAKTLLEEKNDKCKTEMLAEISEKDEPMVEKDEPTIQDIEETVPNVREVILRDKMLKLT